MANGDFQALQRAFSAHLRDPEHAPPPHDVPEPRMRVYRELVYNNLHDVLARGFPVLREVLGMTAWHALVRAFLAAHPCRTPYFREIPREFVQFIEGNPACCEPPFAQELAHYEWIELALEVAQDPVLPGLDPHGDLLSEHPVPSPLAWPLVYRWPVHRIGPDYLPAAPPPVPTHLLALRNAQDEVRFLEINALTAQLVDILLTHPTLAGREALARLARTQPQLAETTVMAGGRAALEELRVQGVILGTPWAADR